MPSYPKGMARNQEVGRAADSPLGFWILWTKDYKLSLSSRPMIVFWHHPLNSSGHGKNWKGDSHDHSHNTPTIFLSNVCPQNPRPVHQTSNPPKSLAVCSVSGISFNQSVWLRRENKSSSFKNLCSPRGFFMFFFPEKKKRKKKQLPQVHQVSPTVHGSFFTRIRWPRSCGHLPPGPGQWCAAEISVENL